MSSQNFHNFINLKVNNFNSITGNFLTIQCMFQQLSLKFVCSKDLTFGHDG